MKNKIVLILVPLMLIATPGCNKAGGDELTFVRNSRAFIKSVSDEGSLPLTTYNRKGEGNVPYVSLTEFLKVAEKTRDEVDTLTYENTDHVYNIRYKSYKIMDINAKTNHVTINNAYKYYQGWYYDADPYGVPGIYQFDTTKKEVEVLWNTHDVSLEKYGFSFVEKNNEIYAPVALYEEFFGMNSSPTGPVNLTYNGVDYYVPNATGATSSCYSTSLTFSLVDPNFAYLAFNISELDKYKELDVLSFMCSSVNPGEGEKYRLESEPHDGFTITALSDMAEHTVPKFKIRVSLFNDGTGKFRYINADTNEEFIVEALGLTNEKTITYTEDNDYLNLSMTYPDQINPGHTATDTSKINKGQSFFLQKTRTKEYAIYDYNITRLHFGEFYGLRDSHPEVMNVDQFFAPYKDEILSEDYLTYNLGMSKMLMSGVDDGHTNVTGFTSFDCNEGFDYYKSSIYANAGYRYKGLLQYRAALMAARANAGLSEGYQVVGDTAYLTFDSFMTSSVDMSTFTEEPNAYVTEAKYNTIAFAHTALKDVKENHPEVKKVVYDITINGGGMVIILPFLLCTMTNNPSITFNDYYIGERITTKYASDFNRDGLYGTDDDTYKGQYDFYILTSGFSFSCGNMFPSAAQYNHCAKIIGRKSGGGASVVDRIITPSGFQYNSSSLMTGVCLDKDGNFIENDFGVDLDYAIDEKLWYNRVELNRVLDQIK